MGRRKERLSFPGTSRTVELVTLYDNNENDKEKEKGWQKAHESRYEISHEVLAPELIWESGSRNWNGAQSF